MLFTIYGLVDPRDNIIKYVGKTINIESRYRQHLYSKDKDWLNDLKKNGLKPDLIKLDEIETEDRKEVQALETEYIIKYKDNVSNILQKGDLNDTQGVLIHFRKDQKEWLDTMWGIHGIKTTALVRRLIDDYIEKVDRTLKEISQ